VQAPAQSSFISELRPGCPGDFIQSALEKTQGQRAQLPWAASW